MDFVAIHVILTCWTKLEWLRVCVNLMLTSNENANISVSCYSDESMNDFCILDSYWGAPFDNLFCNLQSFIVLSL